MWTPSSSLLAVLSASLFPRVHGAQHPFSTDLPGRTAVGVTALYHNGTAASINGRMNLASVPEENFVTLGHGHFPSHQVRVKKSNFCDPTVK
jgi:hypothetical protein